MSRRIVNRIKRIHGETSEDYIKFEKMINKKSKMLSNLPGFDAIGGVTDFVQERNPFEKFTLDDLLKYL